jgi:hypothetical protein
LYHLIVGVDLDLATRNIEEPSSVRCPKCDGDMEYLGETAFTLDGTWPYDGGVGALFRVYVCRVCRTVQLNSDNPPFFDEIQKQIHREVEKKVRTRSFVKNCVSCGSEIPIASEECEFCGSKQPSWEETKREGNQIAGMKAGNLIESRKNVVRSSIQKPFAVDEGDEVVRGLSRKGLMSPRVKPGECMVCRQRVKKGEDAILCPYCKGIAHKAHMLEWLHVKGTCPACRRHLDEDQVQERRSEEK